MVSLSRLTTGTRTGYIASLLWAVFPWFSKWAVTWVWEVSLTALLFTWLIWYALRLQQPATRATWIGFGALWGFALLVNPSMATLLVVSAVWIVWGRTRRGQPWLKNGLLAAVICLAVTSPWLIRNRIVFGEWVFLRDNFGFEFALGNFHGSNGRGWAHNHPTGNPDELTAYSTMGELNYVKTKTVLARQFVRDYPLEFLELTAKRILWFWDGSAIRYTNGMPDFWMPLSYGLFSVLLMPSLLWACLKRLNGWPVFLGAILLYPLPYYLTYGQMRYRHALEPLMLLLVVYAVSDTIARFRSKPAAN
jgi:4-amino-4-deoxy-L-arabinose transferase-like glycosyltransferase